MPKLKFTILFLLSIPVWGAQVGVFTLTDFTFSQVASGGAALPPTNQIVTRMYPDGAGNAWVEWYSLVGWRTTPGQEIDLDFGFRVTGPPSTKVALYDSWPMEQFSFVNGLASYHAVLTGQPSIGPAFKLTSDVPEPSTWRASATGFALLIFSRRRSAARQ